jgi:hypothetical protein
MAFASTVIPAFSLFEIHDQDFCSLVEMYVFRNWASSSMKEGSVLKYLYYLSVSRATYIKRQPFDKEKVRLHLKFLYKQIVL